MLTIAFSTAAARAAESSGAIAIHAESIAFYSDRFLLEADGDVHVAMPDGRTITGETLSIDLRNDRLLVAGGVHLRTAKHDWSGAAFADFFAFHRGYFLPIQSEPDRWTFLDGNYETPLAGRIMPQDVFALPDLSGERVYMYAKSARYIPHHNVVFGPGRLFAGAAYSPVPSYVWNFSENSNFFTNSLGAATFDAPYNFAGGAHSLESLHFRYDSAHHGFLAYEQHLVFGRNWLAFSLNPLNRPDKTYNLFAFQHLSNRLEQTTFFQLSTFQSGLSRPLAATSFVGSHTVYAMPRSSLSLDIHQYNQSLLAQPAPDANNQLYYGDPSHYWDPSHRFEAQLGWNGIEVRPFKKVPLYYRLLSGFGWYHNQFGATSFNGSTFATFQQEYAGFSSYLPPIKVARNYSLVVRLDKRRDWYSTPHYVDTTTTVASLSRSWGTKINAAAYYIVNNVGDNYGSLQLVAYPPYAPLSTWDNQPHPGYAAFRGFATFRQTREDLTLSPNANLRLGLIFTQNKNFPAPIPDTAGGPPFSISGSLHVRVTKGLNLDLTRSYFFNFGEQRWTPQFGIRFGP